MAAASVFAGQGLSRLSHDRVEATFERLVHTATTRNDAFGPVEILTPALERPVGWRVLGDVADVADPVAELDQLGGAGQGRCMFDLQSFALRLGQALVVGHLSYQQPHFAAEDLLQLFRCGRGILDRVVQDCGD